MSQAVAKALPFFRRYGTLQGVSPSKTFDPGRWQFGYEQERDGTMIVTKIEGGEWFPVKLTAFGRYASGPLLTLFFEVVDSRPALRSLRIGAEEVDGEAEVTASVVHDLPLGQIIAETIARTATATLASARASEARAEGRPHQFLTPEEVASTRRNALVSVRGRPVGDETLRRAAEIVRDHPYDYRQKVHELLPTSKRTASRYIAEARKRGFIEEGPNQ
jgi:hypothetical protein